MCLQLRPWLLIHLACAQAAASQQPAASGTKNILQNLDALWEESQFDEVTSLDDFVMKLGA